MGRVYLAVAAVPSVVGLFWIALVAILSQEKGAIPRRSTPCDEM